MSFSARLKHNDQGGITSKIKDVEKILWKSEKIDTVHYGEAVNKNRYEKVSIICYCEAKREPLHLLLLPWQQEVEILIWMRPNIHLKGNYLFFPQHILLAVSRFHWN